MLRSGNSWAVLLAADMRCFFITKATIKTKKQQHRAKPNYSYNVNLATTRSGLSFCITTFYGAEESSCNNNSVVAPIKRCGSDLFPQGFMERSVAGLLSRLRGSGVLISTSFRSRYTTRHGEQNSLCF